MKSHNFTIFFETNENANVYSRLSVAYSNNMIILFATQYKNCNIAVPGDLALLRAFCQWKIEHQIKKCCVKGLILRNMAVRERDASCLYESGFK